MSDRAWDTLLTAALLGTDRRQPPDAPAGPVADVVADLAVIVGDSAPDAALLNQLTVMTVAGRLALQPGRPARLLAPPADDPRPRCSPAAARQWRTIIDEWPVLEDEWLATVWRRGERIPADVLVDLLERHRTDLRRRQLAQQIGGPVVGWMSEHLDVPTATPPRPGCDPAVLPEIPLHPDVACVLEADPGELSWRIRQVFSDARFAAADRRLVENVVARAPVASLPAMILMLDSLGADEHTGAAAAIVADLARRRLGMLASFEEDR